MKSRSALAFRPSDPEPLPLSVRNKSASASRRWTCLTRRVLDLSIVLAFGALCTFAFPLNGCKAKEKGGPLDTLRVGYFANLTHAQAVLGVSSGELERAIYPATLQTKIFNAGPSLIEALFADELDLGYVGPGPVISAHARSSGEGVRVLAGAAANGVVIVARKGSGITSLSDLKGKRIATPQLGNTQDISARHFLGIDRGGDLKNILPVPNTEQASLLARGEIEAAWVPEPWGQRLIAETGAHLVGEEKDLWPTKEFILTLVVTRPEFLAKHMDVVEKFLAVHTSWTSRLVADPEKHIDELDTALFALTGKRLPEGVLPAAMKRVKFTNEPLVSSLDALAALPVVER